MDELKRSLEEHDGRIDGALLSGLEAVGTTFLSDCELVYADLSGANLGGRPDRRDFRQADVR